MWMRYKTSDESANRRDRRTQRRVQEDCVSARYRRPRLLLAGVVVLSFGAPLAAVSQFSTSASAASLTTAWHSGAFALDVGGVVSRSDVVLGQPNTAPARSLPLGNGSLGVAAWAASGFTAQLNRGDTMPSRRSPGQVNVPSLSAMTSASDFSGHLDL